MTTKVASLLKQYIASLPERQRTARELFPDLEEEYIRFKVDPPETSHLANIPTLDSKVSRPLSPQLRDWYATTGVLVDSSRKYLSLSEIKSAVKSARLKKIVSTHRKYWDNSAAMLFPDSQLSLFATINDLVDGDLIYLVWPMANSIEPELWRYSGQSESRYKDLSEYIVNLIES